MMPNVLSIAGFDPVSGAGVTADVKTAAALRCYAVSVVSAITVQNSTGVLEVRATEPELFKKQLEHILSDVEIDAVKVGLLFSSENIGIAADLLSSKNMKNIVVDPIIASSSGFEFHDSESLEAMKRHLLPIAEVVTPNLHEASILSDREVSDLESMKAAAKQIFSLGMRNLVIKGGSLQNMATDLLYDGRKFQILDAPKIRIAAFHGLGCAFSMAIACFLAKGNLVYNSIEQAKKFIRKLMSYPVEVGKGRSVLDHTGK